MVNYTVKVYEDRNGRRPYQKWIDNLRDIRAKVKIISRIDRVKTGNLGDYKSIGDGVLNCEFIMAQDIGCSLE